MAAPWDYNETGAFVSSADVLELSVEFGGYIKRWAVSVNQSPTPRLKPYFISSQNGFQIWVAGLPNPDANKGKSGGYRLVYFLNLRENAIYLDRIDERDEIGFKDEGKRKKDKHNQYLEELKQRLLKELDC